MKFKHDDSINRGLIELEWGEIVNLRSALRAAIRNFKIDSPDEFSSDVCNFQILELQSWAEFEEACTKLIRKMEGEFQ